jgi:hypothetical protein
MVWTYRIGDTRNGYKIFVGSTLGRCKLGKPRWRWKGNIRLIFGRWFKRITAGWN